MRYGFSFGFLVTDPAGTPVVGPSLEVIVDQLMGAMLDRETAVTYDSAVGATLTRGEVDIDLEVVSDDEGAAAALARGFVIEAIRATGGTPIGLFVFPRRSGMASPHQEWHERRIELASA